MSRKAGTPNKPKVEITKDDIENFLPPSGKSMLKQTMPMYFILESTDKNALGELVINALQYDTVPLGGVSVTNYRALDGSISMVYCQAMVRREG